MWAGGHTTRGAETDDEAGGMRRLLRRDLAGLVLVEFVHRFVALVALVGIALHAIAHSGDVNASITMATVMLLALAYLALAFRIRLGADALRRDLYLLEASCDFGTDKSERFGALESRHPYRSREQGHRPKAANGSSPAQGLRFAPHVAIAALAGGLTLALATGGNLLSSAPRSAAREAVNAALQCGVAPDARAAP